MSSFSGLQKGVVVLDQGHETGADVLDPEIDTDGHDPVTGKEIVKGKRRERRNGNVGGRVFL